MKYIPSLDGIRAIAITVVILSHWQIPFFRGGFLGVDLFFVLSGYLITMILLNEWDRTGGISLKHFYLRRAARLMPAFITLLASYGLAAALFAQNPIRHFKGILVSICYLSNWAQAFNLSFPSEISHVWSLCVEEQYYALWPLSLLVMLRNKLPFRSILFIVLVLIASSLGLLILRLATGATDYSYVATDTRIWTILSGAAMAILIHSGWRPASSLLRIAGVVGWVVLAICCVIATSEHPGIFQFCLITLAALAVVTRGALDSDSAVTRFLSWKPLVMIGKLSYSLYLWHYMVIAGLNQPYIHFSYVSKLIIGNLFSVGIAYISYRFIETPFLKMVPKKLAINTVISTPKCSSEPSV